MLKRLTLSLALLAAGLPSAARAQAPAAPPVAADSLAGPHSVAMPATFALPDTQKHFARAALEVTGANVGIWLWCRYIKDGGENTGFRIGVQSWKDNLLNGFEWDDNHFNTNQFAHPYHGSMYFCAARANNFDYWESTAFAFAGSAQWEYFGETHHPSINDWVATSVGGMAVGEMFHRFSGMIIDQTSTGSERAWREIGALVVNPMGGINRLITGDMTRVGPNLPGQHPEYFRSTLRAGARFTGEETLTNADTTRAFVRLRGVHGDQAAGECRTPFDVFSFDIQLNGDDVSTVGRAQVLGLLHSWQVAQGERTKFYFALVQNFDFIDNWAYKYGGQSVGGAMFSRYRSGAWTMDTGLTGNWIILGGTSSDHASFTGRSYDYGPGAGGKFYLSLRRGRALALLESDLYSLRIMNGTSAHHVVTENRLTVDLPLRGPFSIGSEYSMYHAERHYTSYPDVSTRAPQLTVYLAWAPWTGTAPAAPSDGR